MDATLVGSHFLLAALPVWACAPLLYIGTMGVIFVMRESSEGLPYQIAYSAQFGDLALLTTVLIGSTILHRGVALPAWSLGWSFQGICLGVAVAVGATWWWLDHPGHGADIYHHLFVAPVFIYLALSLTPVIASGTRSERVWALCFVLAWATLVLVDVKTGRMDQREWLRQHGWNLTGSASDSSSSRGESRD